MHLLVNPPPPLKKPRWPVPPPPSFIFSPPPPPFIPLLSSPPSSSPSPATQKEKKEDNLRFRLPPSSSPLFPMFIFFPDPLPATRKKKRKKKTHMAAFVYLPSSSPLFSPIPLPATRKREKEKKNKKTQISSTLPLPGSWGGKNGYGFKVWGVCRGGKRVGENHVAGGGRKWHVCRLRKKRSNLRYASRALVMIQNEQNIKSHKARYGGFWGW